MKAILSGRPPSPVCLILGHVGQAIKLHLLYHTQEAIGAGLSQVFGHTNLVNKEEVGFGNLPGRVPGKHPDEQAHQSLYNNGIGVGPKVEQPILHVRYQPHLRLAAFYEVVFYLLGLRQGRNLFAQVYDVLIAIGPVVKQVKFFDDLLLYLVYGGAIYHKGKATTPVFEKQKTRQGDRVFIENQCAVKTNLVNRVCTKGGGLNSFPVPKVEQGRRFTRLLPKFRKVAKAG